MLHKDGDRENRNQLEKQCAKKKTLNFQGTKKEYKYNNQFEDQNSIKKQPFWEEIKVAISTHQKYLVTKLCVP